MMHTLAPMLKLCYTSYDKRSTGVKRMKAKKQQTSLAVRIISLSLAVLMVLSVVLATIWH